MLAWTAMSWVTNRIDDRISRCTWRIMPEHTLLDHDVERGRRLVRDDEFGTADSSQRNRHALTHTAGKLVRIRVKDRRIEVEPLQVLRD